MLMDPSTHRSFRFGPFRFDPRTGDLIGDGVAARLSDQPLALLTALVEQPGRLVTRDELRQRLWPEGTFVDFDHGLNSAVSRLREALQDSAVTPRFVQTIPRRGYRLLVPVEVENDEVPSAGPDDLHSASPSRRSWRRIWIAGAAAGTRPAPSPGSSPISAPVHVPRCHRSAS